MQASGRIQCWALVLSSYEYSIVFRPTYKYNNADAMSHLPMPEAPGEVPIPQELVLLLSALEESPITAATIREWTKRDPVLSKVYGYLQMAGQVIFHLM